MLNLLNNGSLLVLIGMMLMGLIDNFVVEIANHAGLWQFHLLRALVALPILIVFGIVSGLALLPKRYSAVGLRSFFLAASMMLYFGSLPSLPIAVVVAGFFTSPVFVVVFSILFLGVRVGPARISAVVIGFLGVLLVVNPADANFTPMMLLPVLGGALYAINAIAARRLCAEESTAAMLIGFFVMLGIFGAIGLIVFQGSENTDFFTRGWAAPNSELWFWICIQAAGSVFAVGLLTRAYQITETTYLVVFEYSLLIFASFWGYILNAQTVGPLAALGMVFIVMSGVIISRRSEAVAA